MCSTSVSTYPAESMKQSTLNIYKEGQICNDPNPHLININYRDIDIFGAIYVHYNSSRMVRNIACIGYIMASFILEAHAWKYQTVSKDFSWELFKNYHRQLNEHAAILAENDPSLLANYSVLQQKTRESLVASGYGFKKGRCRSQKVTSNIEDNSNSCPKCAKIDTETRNSRIKEVEEGIRDIDEKISFKEKRRVQAETLRDYRQWDEITERLISLQEKKRILSWELVLLHRKRHKLNGTERIIENSSPVVAVQILIQICFRVIQLVLGHHVLPDTVHHSPVILLIYHKPTFMMKVKHLIN